MRCTNRSRSPGARRATSGSRSLAVRGCGMCATRPSLSGDRRLSQASPRPCHHAGRRSGRISPAVLGIATQLT
jgi:hypothetical protein